MRSANNTIATIANYGILIFYVLGGIVLGLFLLNRERWLIWKWLFTGHCLFQY